MIDFYNKYTSKEKYEKFGIKNVHFEPFQNVEDDWDLERESIYDVYDVLKEYTQSTIYQGIRYFFKDLKSLKIFCEKAEKGIL